MDPLNKKKIIDLAFITSRKKKKRHFLSLEMRMFLKQIFERVNFPFLHFLSLLQDPFFDKKNMNFLVSHTGLTKNKLKFFFKNLRLNDYRTKQRHIKTMKAYNKFSYLDTKILEEKFKKSSSLDKKTMDSM